jgi:hypothetical protein
MLNVRQLGMSDVCERLLNVGLNFGRRFVERHKELSPKKKKIIEIEAIIKQNLQV